MTDNRDLQFPGAGDDSELPLPIANRIRALYAATPAPVEGQAQRCLEIVSAGIRRGLPQPFSLRPRWWWGAAAAAVLLVAVSVRTGLVSRNARGRDTVTVASALEVANGQVQFQLKLPSGASKVSIVGDWNQWDAQATPMLRGNAQGAWSAKVALLPGRHVYAYVVNGERWIIDPLAPQADAGYGPANALVVDGAF